MIHYQIQVWDLSSHEIDGLMEDYSFSIANAQEILRSCTKPLKYLKE